MRQNEVVQTMTSGSLPFFEVLLTEIYGLKEIKHWGELSGRT